MFVKVPVEDVIEVSQTIFCQSQLFKIVRFSQAKGLKIQAVKLSASGKQRCCADWQNTATKPELCRLARSCMAPRKYHNWL